MSNLSKSVRFFCTNWESETDRQREKNCGSGGTPETICTRQGFVNSIQFQSQYSFLSEFARVQSVKREKVEQSATKTVYKKRHRLLASLA